MKIHRYHWREFNEIDFDFDSENDILDSIDAFSFKETEKLIHNCGKPKYIISNTACKMVHDVASNIYTVPRVFYEFINEYKEIENTFNDNLADTFYCFNFTINKKNTHRSLMIKIIEWFKLQSFQYRWSGAGRNIDMTHIVNEFNYIGLDDHNLRSFLRSPIELSDNFYPHPESESDHNDICYFTVGEKVWSYQNAIRSVMTNTAVSLITETLVEEHELVTNFTEKTIQPIISLTFPIFVGGYRHPECLKEIGFDIFEDILDHSYQYMPTLWQRCYWAIKLNIKILNDLEYAKSMREQHFERLLNNRKKLFGDIVKDHVLSVTNTWPMDLSEAMKTYWKFK